MASSERVIAELESWVEANGGLSRGPNRWLLGEVKIRIFDTQDAETLLELEKGMLLEANEVGLFIDEWEAHTEACRTFIEARANRISKRVGARETKLIDVSPDTAREFLRQHHIQGPNTLGIAFFGLEWAGQLVGLMALGRHGRQIAPERIVLDRLCFRRGFQIVGGASRLLNAAAEWARSEGYKEILTYSDNRLTPGNTYEKLGFVKEQQLRSDYSYVYEGRRLSKQSQKKSTSRCPDSMTELEWARHRGLVRIHDAGKVRWVFNLHPGQHLTHKDKNSKNAAKMHQTGVFKHSHIRGHFYSTKNGAYVYYSSSYELRCLFLLEADRDVAKFGRCDAFKGVEKWRNPDLLVTFIDGRSEIWEVKPEAMLNHEAVRKQISDSQAYAEETGRLFRVWTEKDSGFKSEHGLIQWGREYHASITGDGSFLERQKEQRRKTGKRFYDKQPILDVSCVWCAGCHRVRKPAFDANVARNGRYICESEGGALAGSRPKPHLHYVNPYASEGKKTCNGCGQIKFFEEFDVNMRHPSGRSTRCKECVSARNRIAYEAKKKENGGLPPKKEPSGAYRKTNPLAAEGKKQCSACDEIKLLGEFNSKKGTYDGLKAFCIVCDRKRDAEYKAKRATRKTGSLSV